MQHPYTFIIPTSINRARRSKALLTPLVSFGGVYELYSHSDFVQETIMARAKIRLDEVADLPPICVCCGEPATVIRRQEFEVNTALSAATLATAAMHGALVWWKRGVTLALPVCEYHKRRGRQSNRTFFRGMALTIAIGVVAYVGSQFNDAIGSYLSVAAMFAFIVTILVGMHQVNDGLGVKSLKSDSFILSGVNPKFAEAIECREQDRRTRGS
jgi:hypothetical protein